MKILNCFIFVQRLRILFTSSLFSSPLHHLTHLLSIFLFILILSTYLILSFHLTSASLFSNFAKPQLHKRINFLFSYLIVFDERLVDSRFDSCFLSHGCASLFRRHSFLLHHSLSSCLTREECGGSIWLCLTKTDVAGWLLSFIQFCLRDADGNVDLLLPVDHLFPVLFQSSCECCAQAVGVAQKD